MLSARKREGSSALLALLVLLTLAWFWSVRGLVDWVGRHGQRSDRDLAMIAHLPRPTHPPYGSHACGINVGCIPLGLAEAKPHLAQAATAVTPQNDVVQYIDPDQFPTIDQPFGHTHIAFAGGCIP